MYLNVSAKAKYINTFYRETVVNMWSYGNKNIIRQYSLLPYNAKYSGCYQMFHEPVKQSKKYMRSSPDPGEMHFLLSIWCQYGSYTAAAADTIQCRTNRSAASPSNRCGPSNAILEECYFLPCWFGALRKKLSGILCFWREIEGCTMGIHWGCDTERFTQVLIGKILLNSNQ